MVMGGSLARGKVGDGLEFNNQNSAYLMMSNVLAFGEYPCNCVAVGFTSLRPSCFLS